jgi:hypothetical protein
VRKKEEEVNEEDEAKTVGEEKITEAEFESKKKERKKKVAAIEHQLKFANKNKAS